MGLVAPTVGVGAGIGHGEEEGLVVPKAKILVGELVPVDRLLFLGVVRSMSVHYERFLNTQSRHLTSPPVPFPAVKSPPWAMKPWGLVVMAVVVARETHMHEWMSEMWKKN